MEKFAQYYVTFEKGNLFAELAWQRREECLYTLLEKEENVCFADKPKADVPATASASEQQPKEKIYRHKVYHLTLQPNIIVMRLANVKTLSVERDFKPQTVEHYPSVFVLFDMRQGCRRVAIQKLSSSFSSTDQVAKILQNGLSRALEQEHFLTVRLRAQRYPRDFYKLWRAQQHHITKLKFNISPQEHMADTAIAPELDDQGVISYIYYLENSGQKSGYRSAIELTSKEGGVLYVDESSELIRNLVRYSAATATSIELITSDGVNFVCYIDSDLESDDKIVVREFEACYLEALFDSRVEGEDRTKIEERVIAFVNDMKRVVDDQENEIQSV